MELYQIDNNGSLFISPTIDNWEPIAKLTIDVVFNLDYTLDQNIPEEMNKTLYIFFPFEDRDLPDMEKLHGLAQFGASLIKNGHQVLSHCGMGHNRSALLAGLILTYLGFTGSDAVQLIRAKRQGALYNKLFATYLESLSTAELTSDPLRPFSQFN